MGRLSVKILLLVTALAAVAFLSYDRRPQARLDSVLGVWTTSDPTYAGRSFEIHKDHIVVALGGDHVYSESIIGAEAQPHDGGLRFTIHTISFGNSYQPKDRHDEEWHFDYDPADGGTIRFQHQSGVIWQKAASSGK